MLRNQKRRLRVVHVTLGLDMGGQEKLLVEMARHTDRERFALHVISLGERGRLADSIEETGCRVIALGEPAGVRPRMVWRLAQEFRRLGADVVHTHDDKPLLYGALAARLAGVRRIIHTHHHGKLPSVSRRQERLVAWAALGVDRFVCVSHDGARQMLAQGVPGGRIRVLWNGIDLERFPPNGPQRGGPIVAVARLSPEKDIANLLRALAIVVRTDDGVRLEIAGDGPCREDLVRLSRELNLGERVRFLGETRDVPALLGRAGMFVLASQTEGVSLTLLEAMACGLPVAATRVGGTPEVVQDGETGLLVPAQNPVALANAIARLRNDFDAGASMGFAGRRRVEAHFDVRAMADRYEALYERRADADIPGLRSPRSAQEVRPCMS